MKLTDGILIIIARLLIVIAYNTARTESFAMAIAKLETKLGELSKL